MNGILTLTPLDLSIAATLVILLAGLTWMQKLGLARQILVAGVRTTVQLTLMGFVLKAIFAHAHVGWVALMALVMLSVAGREVMARQKRRFAGWWGYGLGALSMFVSSFAIAVFALTVVVRPDPWYTPQYAIPLLGMLLGNTMNSIALGLDRLASDTWRDRAVVEGRLLLGQSWSEAIGPIRREAMRTGMIPMINAMAAAGVVNLPGMMTGQILAGNPPMTAVSYQILIMFLIMAGSGFGATVAVWLGARRLFDERQRLRLERLQSGGRFG